MTCFTFATSRMKASSFTYLRSFCSWSRSRMKSSPILCWQKHRGKVKEYENGGFVSFQRYRCDVCEWKRSRPRRWPQPARGCTSPASGEEWCRWSCFGTCEAPFRRSPWNCKQSWTITSTRRVCEADFIWASQIILPFILGTYIVALRMSEWIWATPLTAWEPTMHRWAMLILFWPPSSMRDMRRIRSLSPGYFAATFCK